MVGLFQNKVGVSVFKTTNGCFKTTRVQKWPDCLETHRVEQLLGVYHQYSFSKNIHVLIFI